MVITEKLQQKTDKMKAKMAEKAEKAEQREANIDFGEWLILFMAAGFTEIILIVFIIIGLFPVLGQIAYPILVGILNAAVSGLFFLYLMQKGLTRYWWLAFGGGVANLIPVLNWFGWIGCVMILYFLVKAEEIPLVGETIEKAAKIASKIE